MRSPGARPARCSAPSRGSTLSRSPTFTKSGTFTTAPVSSFAGFVTFETVSPFTPGSVSIDGQLHRRRHLHARRLPVDREHLHRRVRLHERQLVLELGARDGELLVRLRVHEDARPSRRRRGTGRSSSSVCTRGNFSPARNVRSTTAPASRLFSFVRTNAPPLPGLTCWNSTMRHTLPSSSMCIPFLKLFVSTVSATAPDGR